MNTQQSNATLANIEFNPETVQFDGFNVSGLLEADDAVRETYLFNTIEDAGEAEHAFVQSQDLPIGVLLLNPVEYNASEFGMSAGWGKGLEVATEGDVQVESLGFSVVSLEEEDAAAALQVAVSLTRSNGGQDVAIRFQLGSMQLKSEYKNHGHKLDLAAGVCWLAQDIATSLYLSAPAANITVRIDMLNSSEEDDALGANLALTLEGVRAAMQCELDDESGRFASVEFAGASFGQAA